MKTIHILDATAPGVTIGRHSIWAPELGLKMPFQWGGRVTKYGKAEPSYPLRDSLPHEVRILQALAAEGMAPPVGDFVFIENLITRHPGSWHCDPCGAWGYEMADATKLPPGRFSIETMRALGIAGSDGAWGDVEKPGNVVNGYLVDVRRTAWDMLRWPRLDVPALPELARDEQLVADVHRFCQFPAGEREGAYQDFYLAPGWIRGERRVGERADLLGFAPRPGQSVLEIGCQSSGFLQYAHQAMRGEGTILGVELSPYYVTCARRLARANRHNICIREMDAVGQREEMIGWVKERCPRGVDHLLLLSMEKHLGHEAMFGLVDAIGARSTYIETNAVAVDSGIGPEPAGSMKLWTPVAARGGRHVGNSRDRNLRRLYRIDAAAGR